MDELKFFFNDFDQEFTIHQLEMIDTIDIMLMMDFNVRQLRRTYGG